MCELVDLITGKCKICDKLCGFVYYCTKIDQYKPTQSMPDNCTLKQDKNIPDGYFIVKMERKGFLYIVKDGVMIKVKNPFNDVPRYVKVTKNKAGQWKLKKWEGNQNEGN